MEMILEIPFLRSSNANMQFVEKKLKYKGYKTAGTLFTIKKIELIDTREFASAAPNKNAKMFIIYVATLLALPILTM